MASEAASYREDVEQLRRRFAEFRQAHAVRSRLPEELWAAAAKLARREGITATARALDVDRLSLQKGTDRWEPRASAKGRKFPRLQSQGGSGAPAFVELLAASTGASNSCLLLIRLLQLGASNSDILRSFSGPGAIPGGLLKQPDKQKLPSGGRIAAGRQAAAGVEGHRDQPTGGTDSHVCSWLDMLQITPQMRIVVAVEAVDFRKGIDSLAELCRAKLNADPFSGSVFVFRSRRATSIKILVYDGQGFWLATKRLSKGRFRWWPESKDAAQPLRVHQAQVLFAAGNPEVDAAPVWRKVS